MGGAARNAIYGTTISELVSTNEWFQTVRFSRFVRDGKANLMTRKPKSRPYQIEIRDPDDELVTHSPANVHIERMADNHWWMRINIGSETVIVEFTAKGQINSTMERE